MTLLLMLAGNAFGGQRGMLIASSLPGVLNFVSYFFSDKTRSPCIGAKPVSREELRGSTTLWNDYAEGRLPMPKFM